MISKTSQQDLILQHTQSKIELQDKIKIIKQKKHRNSIAVVSGAVAFVASCIGIVFPLVADDTRKLHDRSISPSDCIKKNSDNSNQFMNFFIAIISTCAFVYKMVDKMWDNYVEIDMLKVEIEHTENLIAQIKAEMQKSEGN